jgi:hypothetical protein
MRMCAPQREDNIDKTEIHCYLLRTDPSSGKLILGQKKCES